MEIIIINNKLNYLVLDNNMLETLKKKYPMAISWSFGDNAQLADELAMLVVEGRKTATSSSLNGFFSDSAIPVIGGLVLF